MVYKSFDNGSDHSYERGDWWRQSMVKRTSSYVKDDLQHVLDQSPFLQQSQPRQDIALFHRSEIVTDARLGRGGFSNVYEVIAFQLNPSYSQLLSPAQQEQRTYYCEQIRTGRGRYAIKFLQQRLLNDPKSFQCAASDLAVEAAYMSALDHPNILSVRGLPIHGLDSLSEGRHDSYFIILDRLESTLDKKISQWKKQQDFPLLGKAGYALQLTGALQYLHERGIMFRDLKPANIGLTFDGSLNLFDFGLSREIPVGSSPDDVFEMSGVGTRRYMAVEIVNSSCYNDKADVYSMAMVFWEMLSLEKPFSSYSVDDHKRYVCQGGQRPTLYKNWPLTIQNLLKHSWTTSISDRLSMQEVECLLRTYIECCKLLGETPESPNAVADKNLFLDAPTLQLDLPLVWNDNEEALMSADQHEASLLKDHRMSVTLQDLSHHSLSDDISIESSVFESVAEGTSTDVSSFDMASDHYLSMAMDSSYGGFDDLFST